MGDIPFLGKVVDLALEASIRQLGYVINYKDHEQELKELITTLESHKRTLDEQVQVAINNAEEITSTTQDWLDKVTKKLEESKEFDDDEALKSKTSCFGGGCSSGALPFLWHRRQLGRKAKKILTPAIEKLNDKSSHVLANISSRPTPTFADSNPSDGDYLKFKSRMDIIEKIMEQLKDSTVRMVGLHGPSGVGKTSLVKQIAKQAENSKLFDKVIMAIVKKDPDLQKVQQDIADGLRLNFENEGENGRATRLRKSLQQTNTLVILDDLWDELDLNKIGVPFDDDHGSSHKLVGKEQMGGETDISGKMMKNESSRGTTKGCKKVVGMTNEDPKFKPETLKNYCAGLPMAVIIVGRSLMNKSKSDWEEELERLKNQQGSNEVQKYMEGHVKMGYDHLESEELKSIFLVYPQMCHQSLIVDLVKYCFGLGILKDVHTLRDARQCISKSIKKLQDSGLLDSTSNDNFNMHDIIRDAALSIACKNQNAFILRNKTLDVWPDKDQLERCTAIYLHKCHIVDELPKVVNCPRLTFFYIDCDGSTLKIPDKFFEGMEELKVLVLSGIHFECLPSSIKCLRNLRMLCLEKCTLGNLSILNNLRKLRILSLSGSTIEDWPTVLEGLSKLQLLDISDCLISSSTGPLSLSSFTNLEELYVSNSLPKMEVKGQKNNSQHSVLSELKHLHQLNTIDVCIPSVELLPTDLFFHELNDYKIVIGDFETLSIGDFKMLNRYEASRSLALQLEPGRDDIHSLKGIKLLFKGVENLLLGDLHGVQNAFYELNLDGFPNLKHLSIVNNKDIEYIVNWSCHYLRMPFPI
ncbi:hypothetical protein PIB30_051797 [Stylosanthes scabra]|uniref:AAA+ ATPase domain-containing protein n=1 Tax=Stylosanthes scabra TaxID=79078 RepID=A0ABU6UHF8_9FABA|nr:hypothetical protein [Stylosanthes scabra]